jgi:hypothetical protein
MENANVTPENEDVSWENAIVSLENRNVTRNYLIVFINNPKFNKLWHLEQNLQTLKH